MRHTKTQRGPERERPRCTSVGRQRAIGRINPVQAPTRVWAAAPRWLVVMVKVPEAGRVKTRLGRQIGTVVATSFYRAASAAVIGRLARDSRWRTVLAVAPDTGLATRSWPSHRLRVAQGNGDLGQRMQRLFALRPPGPVLIIGTDIPAIEPRHIASAFKRLGRAGAVLAPVSDGGYWAVGQRRTPRIAAPFADVRWSSADALADTARGFGSGRYGLADTLEDIDDRDGWLRVRAWSGRRVLPKCGL